MKPATLPTTASTGSPGNQDKEPSPAFPAGGRGLPAQLGTASPSGREGEEKEGRKRREGRRREGRRGAERERERERERARESERGGEGGKPTRAVPTAPSNPVLTAVGDSSRGEGLRGGAAGARIRKEQLRWAACQGLGEGNGSRYVSLPRPSQTGQSLLRKLEGLEPSASTSGFKKKKKATGCKWTSFLGQPSHWPQAMSFQPPPPPTPPGGGALLQPCKGPSFPRSAIFQPTSWARATLDQCCARSGDH